MVDNDYISRAGIIAEYDRQHQGPPGGARKIMETFPAADVRPVVRGVWKHVRWVRDDDEQVGGYWISRCSNCSMPYHAETPFCPHCGADMREES